MTFFFACGAIQAGLSPAGDAPGHLGLRTKRVIVFKDGHGLFIKEATGTARKDGAVFTDEVPEAASLGSFWVSVRDDHIAYDEELYSPHIQGCRTPRE